MQLLLIFVLMSGGIIMTASEFTVRWGFIMEYIYSSNGMKQLLGHDDNGKVKVQLISKAMWVYSC